MKILKLKTNSTERILMIGNSEEIRIHGTDLIGHGYLIPCFENFSEIDNDKFFGLLINPNSNVRLVNADHILGIYFDNNIIKEPVNIIEFSEGIIPGEFIWRELQYLSVAIFNNTKNYSRTILYSKKDTDFIREQYEKINSNTECMKSSLGKLTYEFNNQVSEDGKIFTSFVVKTGDLKPAPIKYGADFFVSEMMNEYIVSVFDIEFEKFENFSQYVFNYETIRDFCGMFHGSKKKNEQLLYVLPSAINELAKKIANNAGTNFDEEKHNIIDFIMAGCFLNYVSNLDVKATILDALINKRVLSDNEIAAIVDYFYVDQITVELEIIATELIKKL